MTTRRRLVPDSELRSALDTLREYGFDVARCVIDIGHDGVKVSPPANQNPVSDLAQYINRPAHRPKAGEKR